MIKISRIEIFLNLQTFFCYDCDEGFIFETSYKKHTKEYHSTEEKTIAKCEFCVEPTEFSSFDELKKHNVETHESNGQKICQHCDYKCKDWNPLRLEFL